MTNKYPRLRSHTRKRKSGRVTVYYFYDRRPEGLKDIPLGTDYDQALKLWDKIHNQEPLLAGTIQEAINAWLDAPDGIYANRRTAETIKSYRKHVKQLEPVFGPASWDAVSLPDLKKYLRARTGKTQANRELSVLQVIWNWARGEGYTSLQWPAAGLTKSKWKNEEKPREVEVTPAMFDAVYTQADQTLRDCMDLASATGMRLTDCRTILLPAGDALRLKASKTGKKADFDLSLSAVLPDLLKRRRAIAASHLMLLSTSDGKPVTQSMLRSRWDEARARAAVVAGIQGDDELVRQIRGMYLRDMRKMAAGLSGSAQEAARLLQHSSERVTREHYYFQGDRLKPVR